MNPFSILIVTTLIVCLWLIGLTVYQRRNHSWSLSVSKSRLYQGALLLISAAMLMGAATACSQLPLNPTATFAPTATTQVLPTGTVVDTLLSPAVSVLPDSGTAGSPLELSATGFPANSLVDVGIGRVNSEYDVIKTATTDEYGSLETSVVVPGYVNPQDQWVIVVAVPSRAIKAISEPFDVTGANMPTDTPSNLFSRTNIYLIAIDDAGQTGMEIGCGDSVVPVEIQIEPTIAPLTAGLEYLLDMDSEYYGQSGLYNALYQSELEIESINIENGKATIRLSGIYRVGGVCDEPRVKAQIEEAALQYPTVDEVSIFINGTMLE